MPPTGTSPKKLQEATGRGVYLSSLAPRGVAVQYDREIKWCASELRRELGLRNRSGRRDVRMWRATGILR